MNAMGQSLAVALAPHDISVVTVAPGWVDTDMAQETLASPQGDVRPQSKPAQARGDAGGRGGGGRLLRQRRSLLLDRRGRRRERRVLSAHLIRNRARGVRTALINERTSKSLLPMPRSRLI